MSDLVGLRERLERLSNRGEDRGPEWLIASVNQALTEPAPSLDPARRPLRRPLITVAFAFVAVVAVVAAVVAFGAGRHSSPSPATTPTSTVAPMSGFDGQPAFLSANEGWLCHGPLEHTTDGGRAWQRIGIAQSGLEFTLEECAFAAGGHAWVTNIESFPPVVSGVTRVVAGSHTTVTFVPLPGATRNTRFLSIAFVDALHGWALTYEQSNAEPVTKNGQIVQPPATLYGTTDGGVRWQQIATKVPVEGHLRFTSPTEGWGLSLTQLEHTTDGGRTWRTVPIAATPVLPDHFTRQLWSVSVFGNRLVVAGLDSNRTGVEDFFVEVSNDAGAHWSLLLVPAKDVAPPFAKPWQFVAVDADHWRYVDAKTIAGTDDAGKTWRVRPNTAPISARAAVSFVTPDTAFAVECGLGTAPCHSAVTTDDGATWRLTQPSRS